MKYIIMAKQKTDKKYGIYCGYTNLMMKLFAINKDLTIDNYDVADAICYALKTDLPEIKFKIKEA